MKIDDLILLLDNRLREFKLSKDYARMSGDLERMNAADKEVISLEDTLFKLKLLVDTSKSAAVKDAILAEVITDGSVAVLGEYDITPYATDPKHEEKIMNILSKMGVMDTAEKIDDYITGKYWSSPVTGEMVMSASLAYEVDARLMMAIMEQDSSFGTAGKAVRTLNPGNVGNDDSGNTRTYESWQEGVTAVAEWLSRHRGSTIISETPLETILEPTATSTSSFDNTQDKSGQATSTPSIITTTTATTTPVAATSTSSGQATSTPPIITPTATTTTSIATSTPETLPVITSTTTTTTATSTPTMATSTPTTATTTPVTATSTSSFDNTQDKSGQATSTEETLPVTTSTTTTTTATSTPTTADTSTPATSTPETLPVTTSTTTTTTATTTAN